MSFPGGKNGAGVFQTLINLMPPHDVYVEAFIGGGAVMRQKKPAAVNVGIDVDRIALETVRMPAGSPLPAMPCGISRPGEARRRRTAVPAWGPKLLDPLAYPSDATRPTFELRHGDAIEFLRTVDLPSSALVYADPPYLLSSRKGPEDLYRFEMMDHQHRELLRVIKQLRCRVLISGYSSTLYAKELKSWNAASFQAGTRRGPAAEWVWYNYPKPEQLHDYRFVGDTFRQRDHLKRMIRRWKGKLQRMPAVKRNAVLAAIASSARNGDEDLALTLCGSGVSRSGR